MRYGETYEELMSVIENFGSPRIEGKIDLNELQEQGMLYHATPLKNVLGILRRGLLTRFANNSGYLCLTPYLQTAIYFANSVHHLSGVGGLGIFGVDKGGLPQKIRDEFREDPLSPSISVITRRDISPRYIQEVILANQGVKKGTFGEISLEYVFEELSTISSRMGKRVRVIDLDCGTNMFNPR